MNSKQQTRKAAFAGSWYEGNQAKLNQELNNYLQNAQLQISPIQKIKAMIGPHAGYRYSGPTQAWSYKYINPQEHQRIFLLGPSHRQRFQGCGLSSCNSLDTPFGQIQVDTDVIQELIKTGSFVQTDKQTEEAEHSLEMHLPYIKKIMGDKPFTIVPIMVGQTSYDLEQKYGGILSKYFDDEKTLFIISSDFCHWGERFNYQYHDPQAGKIYQSIQKLDKEGMDSIESHSSKKFAQYLNETSNTICGRRGIGILLHIIEQSALSKTLKTKFVQYAQSSQVVDEDDSSVSYASAITYI
ncbi:AmmeMemoRadiSam system protein B (macronuclear) [Tetrahymena thermophila SB210]|uniref:AmmeMemoRadiSam system protein B n=1 Tax=Tetrahymena thermophila (strain SB210) TaxID=312017 RepID=I7MCZ5_TETTS|nr:AmmeMemoRadiSam system protein B [Tetrahymena thermophila SB210]EAR85206.2 AmmeMemoRadiSam system protein B [Tetrahymena thermophila SB210]|eukprot:XP_001032869.2 AmmeMemoRadiSam system protein B [Tetrahymena thermophila SB210]